jgi:SAM-dependent methyltransferase
MDGVFQRTVQHFPALSLIKQVGYDKLSHNTANPSGNNQGSKNMNYLFAYERHFCGLRRNLTLLNIGVLAGHSLRNYADFLGTAATIVGLDISLGLWQNQSEDPQHTRPNIRVHEGDQTKSKTFQDMLQSYPGKFDVIVEDGCHLPCANATLHAAWPVLKPGGLYIAEHMGAWSPVAELATRVHDAPHPATKRDALYRRLPPGTFHALDVETVTYGAKFTILAKYNPYDRTKSWQGKGESGTHPQFSRHGR